MSAQDVLVKALAHPLRAEILTCLSDRIASPKELSVLLGMSDKLSNVSYHVRVLDEIGMIEIVEEESVRGSVAHFYQVVDRRLIPHEDWASLNPKVRNALSGHVIDGLLTDLAESASAGLLDKRDDRLLTRTSMLLDESGWLKILEIQTTAYEGILKESAAATKRIESKSHCVPIRASLGLLFFETPAEERGSEHG